MLWLSGQQKFAAIESESPKWRGFLLWSFLPLAQMPFRQTDQTPDSRLSGRIVPRGSRQLMSPHNCLPRSWVRVVTHPAISLICRLLQLVKVEIKRWQENDKSLADRIPLPRSFQILALRFFRATIELGLQFGFNPTQN